jgi:hypothetical protein
MNMRTYKDIEGPWNHEPDHLEWIDEDTGLTCIILRHPELGHLCGYVVVPESNLLYGKDWMDGEVCGLDAHGGITFSKERYLLRDPTTKKHLIGFDCAHAGDLSPGNVAMLDQDIECRKHIFDDEEEYRDIEYVQHECKNLAKQIAEFKCTEKSDSSGIGAKE